ncbi:Synaptotagmin-like protein [Perkinsela sp. CCAP 1560/4]|nr:Synaptotagmin-like protein [Perkinsela sp. CCAP 1560/4]|eukprot:KNH03698.1 Synaptotagmin-like protein [Perkinsela sp. CCAP 1560/4]
MLAGIILKNQITDEKFPTVTLKEFASEAHATLEDSTHKIARIAALIVVRISKIGGFRFWCTLEPKIDLIGDIWKVEQSTNRVFFDLMEYIVEDMFESMLEESPDFIIRITSSCSKNFDILTVLHTCFAKGNAFDWFAERDCWNRVQIALSDGAGAVVNLVTTFILDPNSSTHTNEILKLMTVLIEYQELCAISYNTARLWTFYAVEKCVFEIDGESPFFENSCWYIIQLKEAYLQDEAENIFQHTIHDINIEKILPILMQKLVLLPENVSSIQADIKHIQNALHLGDTELDTLESVNLITVRRDRYISAKCIECLASECPDAIDKLLKRLLEGMFNNSWEITEAIIIVCALAGQYLRGDNSCVSHQGIPFVWNILCDHAQNPILQSASAFALSRYAKNYSLAKSPMRGKIIEALITGASNENSLVRICSLRGILSFLRTCVEDATYEESSLPLEKITWLLNTLVEYPDMETFVSSMTIFELLLNSYPSAVKNRDFLLKLLIKKLQDAIAATKNDGNCMVLSSTMLVLKQIILSQHEISVQEQEVLIICAARALEDYLMCSMEKDDVIYERSVQLLSSIFQRFPNSKEIIPPDFAHGFILHAIYSACASKLNAMVSYLPVMLMTPVCEKFVTDFNEIYLPALINFVGNSEATGAILWSLSDCVLSLHIPTPSIERILDLFLAFLNISSSEEDYDAQTCALCIGKCFDMLINKHPSYFQNPAMSSKWNPQVQTILKILRVMENDASKYDSTKGVLKYIMVSGMNVKSLLEELILLLASFHETIKGAVELNGLASQVLVSIKNDSSLRMDYTAILQRRRLSRFEQNFTLS